MKVPLQADADLNQGIVAAILRREPGINFHTTTTAEVWPNPITFLPV